MGFKEMIDSFYEWQVRNEYKVKKVRVYFNIVAFASLFYTALVLYRIHEYLLSIVVLFTIAIFVIMNRVDD